ncbi:MAG: 3-dehydroquinate synthase [Verrucomicrobiales bacterium]
MLESIDFTRISLGDRSYDAAFGRGLLDRCGGLIAERAGSLGKRCAVVADSNVAPLYADRVCASLRGAGFDPVPFVFPAGEASKSMAQAESVGREMIRAGLDRRSFLVALGGGVTGDLAGFVAAIFYRGIPFVQIPTSVVAQVDSSVGGKTGVNAPEGKNLIGAFHQPRLVLADADTLETLPPREFNEGFAEIIKHAAIRDPEMFSLIDAARADRSRLPELIGRNIRIKADIVEADETETAGLRALLNFGHTIGHAIESAGGYGRFLHGEAISLGLVAAARISQRYFGLGEAGRDAILQRLADFDLPGLLDDDLGDEAILAKMARDKKFLEGAIRFVVVPELGKAEVTAGVTREMIAEAVRELRHS